MWKVRLYKSTGFNLINVPDDPSLLEQKPHKNFGVIDCLQRFFLTTITIRAFEDDVILGDFLKLYDDENENNYAYYVVNGYTMTSGDTVQLDVAMEPLLTCGGIDNITIVDGMVSRHHLGADEALPTEKDPMLVPKKVYIQPVAYFLNGPGNSGYKLMVRSILDANALEEIMGSITPEDVLEPAVNLSASYDPNTQTIDSYTGLFCSSPIFKTSDPDDDPTDIRTFDCGGDPDITSPGYVTDLTDGTYYILYDDADKNTLSAILKKLAEYGREDVILDAYFVPQAFELDAEARENPWGSANNIETLACFLHRDIGTITYYCQAEWGAYKVLPSYGTKKPSEYHNQNIFFGDNFAYTFVSPDNNQSIKINPEEFYDPSVDYDETPSVITAGDPTPDVAPKVLMSYDLRPGGNATYTIQVKQAAGPDPFVYLDDRISPYTISTDSWDTASLAFSATSGAAMKAKNYAMSSYNKDAAVEMDAQHQIENKTRGLRFFNPFAQAGSIQDNILNYNAGSLLEGSRAQQLQQIGSQAAKGNEFAKARYDRLLQREQEDMEFMSSMVPKTQVVSKASGSSVINGQGLIVFRNFVSEEDLERFDKIINKYGCKHTTMLTKDMLTNRPRFNYVETQGVSIKCPTVPKSVRDELANAFNTGLRIWHVKDVDPNAWNDPVEEES